jgi:ABC-type proline/glycine betaine transport system permease subunit
MKLELVETVRIRQAPKAQSRPVERGIQDTSHERRSRVCQGLFKSVTFKVAGNTRPQGFPGSGCKIEGFKYFVKTLPRHGTPGKAKNGIYITGRCCRGAVLRQQRVIGYFGMWEDTMSTLAIISVSTLLCISVGIPIGILMSRSDRLQSMVTPVLDVMQTIPSFVYLIPVVMLLGIGKVPGLIAVFIYALPPIVRLTNLGIRLVDKEVLEASESFGASYSQKLFGVQIPLALPNIFAGVNQTIMMALAMVVIASMIGVKGLGVPVLRAVSNQYLALGMLNGLAIVALAIIFDRISQSFGKRMQKHLESAHGV